MSVDGASNASCDATSPAPSDASEPQTADAPGQAPPSSRAADRAELANTPDLAGEPPDLAYPPDRDDQLDGTRGYHTCQAEDDSVLLVGTKHIHDSEHPLSKLMTTVVKEWASADDERPPIIFIEGRLGFYAEAAEGDADGHSVLGGPGGESSWLSWFGSHNGIETRSLISDDAVGDAHALAARFGEPAVFAYMVMRELPGGLSSSGEQRPDMDAFTARFATEHAYLLTDDADPATEFHRVIGELYPDREAGATFTEDDVEFLLTETVYEAFHGDPSTPVQAVARACNLQRDTAAARIVNEALAEGSRALVVFGRFHFAKLRESIPALADRPVGELNPFETHSGPVRTLRSYGDTVEVPNAVPLDGR